MQQHAQKGIAIALTSRQYPNLFEYIVIGKQERAQQSPEFGLSRTRGDFPQVIQNARLGIEFLVLILRKVIRLNVVPDFIFSRSSRFCPGEQFDQRRFPCTIHADKGNPVAALDDEIHAAKNLFLAVVLAEVCHLRGDPATGFWLWERKMDGALFWRSLDPLDLLQFFDSALNLFGLGSLVAVTVDE